MGTRIVCVWWAQSRWFDLFEFVSLCLAWLNKL